MKIGKKIKELRTKYNLTQEELANRLELTKGYISQLENDLTEPSISTLEDIVLALGTNLSDFFNDEKEENKVIYKKEDYFVKEKCEIILIACRIKGTTKDAVINLRNNDWQVIWFKNSIMKVDVANQSSTSTPPLRTQDARLQERLSRDYAFYVASLIERLVLTEGII